MTKEHRLISPEQIGALKYFIMMAPDGTELAKKFMFYLLDQSEGLTKSCVIEGTPGTFDRSPADLFSHLYSVQKMASANCNTHLGSYMVLMGTDMHFSVGRIPHNGTNIWLSRLPYGRREEAVNILTPTLEMIDRIDIYCPGHEEITLPAGRYPEREHQAPVR